MGEQSSRRGNTPGHGMLRSNNHREGCFSRPELSTSTAAKSNIRLRMSTHHPLNASCSLFAFVLVWFAAVSPRVLPADDRPWARATADDRAIKIETDKLEAVIPKKEPKHWMTGIEKHSFRDKATGFHEIGDGLMVVDWIMEAGSDEAYADQLQAPDGHGVGPYRWHADETDPAQREYARLAHGSSHRKRAIEGPQLCHRMKPVDPEIIRGDDFIAVKTTYQFEYAAPGRNTGSRWTQLIVFPAGKRYFLLMDRIDAVNDSPEMFLRNDTPGCVRHEQGDTFSEMYLS